MYETPELEVFMLHLIPKVKQLSVADMFAETIRRLLNNESISDQYIVRN